MTDKPVYIPEEISITTKKIICQRWIALRNQHILQAANVFIMDETWQDRINNRQKTACRVAVRKELSENE